MTARQGGIARLMGGLACGLILPAVFMAVYIYNFYPGGGKDVLGVVARLWGTTVFGKLMLLSLMPDLVLIFIFYKQDRFHFGAGALLGMLPYLILCVCNI